MMKTHFLHRTELVEGHIDESMDAFFLAKSADGRAYEVLSKMSKGGGSVKKVYLLEFEERIPQMLDEQDAYVKHSELGFDECTIRCSISDPSSCMRSLAHVCSDMGSDVKIGLDISCITRPYLFALLRYCRDIWGIGRTAVFYTEPRSYIFDDGLLDSFHSSHGPLSVMEIPGFPGQDALTKESILVITLGFDGQLAAFISDEIAPHRTILINGFPAYFPKFKDISLTNNEKLVNSTSPKHMLLAGAADPFAVYNALEELRVKNAKSFISIAPIGPKPMALGACLFALEHKSVRVLYPLPQKYAAPTAESHWCSWRYETPLHGLVTSSH